MKKRERYLVAIAVILNLLWLITNLALAQVSEMGYGCDLCDPYRQMRATCFNTFRSISTNFCPSYDKYGKNWREEKCFRWFPLLSGVFLCLNSCRRDWYECNGDVIPVTQCLGRGHDCHRILPPTECTAQACP